ncbi:MAG: hypothetical protein AB9861_11055 [Methanosarcina sp.]|jgi:hypothetical protein
MIYLEGKYLADEEVLKSLPGTMNPLPTRFQWGTNIPVEYQIKDM